MMGRRGYISSSIKSQTCVDSKRWVSASMACSIVGLLSHGDRTTAPCALRATRQRCGWRGAYQPAARGILDDALHIDRYTQGGEQVMRLSDVQGSGFTLALTLGELGQGQMRAANF